MSTKSQLQEIYIGLLGRAADAEGLDYWAAEVDAGTITLAEVRENIVNDQPEYEALFAGKSRAQTVNQLYINLFGRAAEADGLNYWVNGEGANVPADLLVFALSDGAAASDRLILDNRVEVAQYYTDNAETFSAGAAAAVIANVDGTNESVADAKASIGSAADLTLTQRADNLVGTAGDDVFVAPVTQNETGSGELANTFETGDVLDGGAGRDTLQADLIASGTVGLGWQSPAISATTSNIEEVYLRAQNIQGIDFGSNTTAMATIDAERMSGVEQWWSDNSRANIRIEDIRTNPADTTFGLRQTDPEVGFEAYFNPLYLEGDLSRESALSLTIQEITNGQNPANTELQNITVREINFELDGEGYTLNNDALRAANTWAELETAIAAELLEQGLADLTVTHRGNGQFLVEDTQGREFGIVDGEALILGNASGIDVRNRAQVGVDEQEGPTQTTLILDAAGNGSRGGDVNIAAMSGDRGIEVMDVQVDRDSHIRTLRSENNPNDTGSYAREQQLEEVYLSHVDGGANGSLQLGSRTVDQGGVSTTTDDRLAPNGLLDVRVFDATGFTSSLKLGASLTDSVFDKYLDGAEEAVQFSYLLGDGGSNLNLYVDNGVASDPDFALEIIGGAGDDRINLSGLATKRNTVIDGGAGNNTVEVDTTTVAGASAWAGFENVQTLVVAGNGGSTQNLVTGNMASIEDVIVATNGGSTTIQQLRMDQGLTVSGKNQTLGSGNSNNGQVFGTISIEGTSAVPGVNAFDLLLDNTARIDGALHIGALNVGATATGVPSAISTLNIESAGRRDTVNVIHDFTGAAVTTLNLVGTQDLSINVSDIASTGNTTPPVTISGTQLSGDLTLGLDAALLDNENLDVLRGTHGTADTLVLSGAVDTNAVVAGFETIQFDGAAGDYDAVNTTGVGLYDVQALTGALTIDNMRQVETVLINSFTANQDITLDAASRGADSALNVTLLGDQYTSELAVNDFRTVNVNLQHTPNDVTADTFTLDLVLNGYENAAGDEFANYASVLNFTGGRAVGAEVDSLVVTDLPASLTRIDFSGFVGTVDASFGAVLDQNGAEYGTRANDAADGIEQAGFITNTTVVLNGYGFEWDGSAVVDPTVTTFRFTSDALVDIPGGLGEHYVWEFNGFKGFGATNDLGDLDILDLRSFGVETLSDIQIVQDGLDTVITSNLGHNFEIVLTGITANTDLSNENFVFAA